jgi:3-dehydroquinate synthase
MLPDGVLISSDISYDLQSFLAEKRYSQVCVLTDENTLAHCYPVIKNALPEHFTIEIQSGEEQKNLQSCITIWQKMTDHALDRHALAIVLGGGVLGDMGGFCAATYKRGIDFILIPTTLLAQADASIGGKLGIDFNHLKNHIGVFQLPVKTILYAGFLKTLPTAELRSGFAEVVKHTLISDRPLWDKIRIASVEKQNWDILIRHSAEFKSDVVAKDPKERGLRKILNAGHTIGHALESYLLAKSTRILHGEAIAVGLICEAYISLQRKMIDDTSFNQIKEFILHVYGKIGLQENELGTIAALALQDKKNKGNKILCVLFDQIGSARWDCEISVDEVKEALSFYRSAQM